MEVTLKKVFPQDGNKGEAEVEVAVRADILVDFKDFALPFAVGVYFSGKLKAKSDETDSVGSLVTKGIKDLIFEDTDFRSDTAVMLDAINEVADNCITRGVTVGDFWSVSEYVFCLWPYSFN